MSGTKSEIVTGITDVRLEGVGSVVLAGWQVWVAFTFGINEL